MTKLCVDCKHFREGLQACAHPSNATEQIDLVYGNNYYRYARTPAQLRGMQVGCGISGAWFEEKDGAPKKKEKKA